MTGSTGDKAAKILVIALGVLIIGFGFYAYNYLLEWRKEEVDTGPTREARKNPFLAAELFLNRLNIETEVTRSFSLFDDMALNGEEVGKSDTVIVINGRGAIKGRRFDNALSWIEQGGTLVTSTANPFIGLTVGDDPLLAELDLEIVEMESEDESADEEETSEGESEDPSANDDEEKEDKPKVDLVEEILNALKEDPCETDAPLSQVEFAGEDETLEADFRADNYLDFYEQEPAGWISNETGVVLTYHEVDDGYVYVTVDNQIWTNSRIQCFDHAYVLWQLINPEGKVWFVMNQESPSLTAMIWTASPAAVTAALLSLLLWLWKSGVRLGPVYRPKKIERRSFAEHIHANAVFLWRHQRPQILVDQLKKDILLRVGRRIRHFDSLDDSEQLDHLEQLTGLDRTEIHRAFFQPLEKYKQDFVVVCKTLKKIKEKL